MYITKKCSLTENRINSDLGPIIMHAAAMHDELLADSEMGDEDGGLAGPFGAAEPEASEDRNPKGKVELHLRRLKAQLEDHLGTEYVPEILTMSEPMLNVIDAMKSFSELSGLGAFHLAHLTGETGEKILLNGDEPLVLRFDTSCHLDKIVDFLQMRDQS